MMLKTHSLFLLLQLLILSFLFGCSDEKQNDFEVIKINPEKNSNSILDVEILSEIPLETNDKSLIGDIDKMIYFKDKIYILDVRYRKALLVFNSDGSFHAATKKGRGPGEIMGAFSFSVNKRTNEIMLWDQYGRSMYYFDLDLNYLRHEKNDLLIRHFEEMGKDTFLILSYKLTNNNMEELTTYSIYTDNFSKALGHYLPVNMNQESQTTLKPMSNYSQMLFIKPWDGNIYSFVDNEIQIKYKFDFGKYNITDNDLEISNSERWAKVRNGEKIGSLYNLSESENYITARAFFENKLHTFVYSKKHKNAIRLEAISTLPQCVVFGTVDGANDTFIAEIEAKNLGGATLSDNPVLITFKMIDKP